MIDTSLYTKLAALCPRTYPLTAPKGVQSPFVVYSRVSTIRQRSFDGPVGVAWPTFRVDVYAKLYDDARLLADAIRGALDGYSDEGIADCALVNELDLSELTFDPELTRTQLEFRISHNE